MEMDPFFAVTDAVDNTAEVITNEPSPPPPPPPAAIASTTTSMSNDSNHHNDHVPPTKLEVKEESSVMTSSKPPSLGEEEEEQQQQQKFTTNPSTTNISSIQATPNRGGNGEGVVDHVELANEEIANLLLMAKGFAKGNGITQTQVSSLQQVLRDNGMLKNKITKLKNLLQRSAKAQKDTKTELIQHKSQLQQAQDQIQQLQRRVESLSNRPTHMDLLADFERNFDKALLSFPSQQQQHQSGGQTSSPEFNQYNSSSNSGNKEDVTKNNSLISFEEEEEDRDRLEEEWRNANARIQQLESRLKVVSEKRLDLQEEVEQFQMEKETLVHKCDNLQLECRMAKLEMERSARAAKEKTATLSEMQLEMNLMYKSVSEAYAHAAHATTQHNHPNSTTLPNSTNTIGGIGKYDLNHPHSEDLISSQQAEEMKAKMEALQEWALASANVKALLNERIANLTDQVKELKRQNQLLQQHDGGESAILANIPSNDQILSRTNKSNTNGAVATASAERVLWDQTYSLVVGAGLVGSFVVDLGHQEVAPDETILLQYKFDITPTDTDIDFSILKGRFENNKALTRAKRYSLETVLSNRTVVSGGAGEVQGAFAVQNACTLVWSNEKSWIRPKTIKFYLQAVAIE